MFDKVKQIQQLRELQKAAEAEKFESESSGVRATVNGALQVESIVLNGELENWQQQDAVKQAVNDALKRAQMSMAQKFSGLM